jgi:hypothetical protein
MAAKESKKNEVFNKWIESKIKNTFIEVSSTYQTCENLQRWLNPEGDTNTLKRKSRT